MIFKTLCSTALSAVAIGQDPDLVLTLRQVRHHCLTLSEVLRGSWSLFNASIKGAVDEYVDPNLLEFELGVCFSTRQFSGSL